MPKRFLIAAAFVAFAVLRGASPAWAEDAVYAPACASLPRDLIKETLADGLVWEPHVVRNLQAHVVPGSVALDVGAYIGTHALLMGRLAGPQGRVYAFEPQRKAYRGTAPQHRTQRACQHHGAKVRGGRGHPDCGDEPA